MVTLVEFLDKELIENIVTSINYKIDKVIFFGYQYDINLYYERTKKFLLSPIGVKEVEVYSVSKTDFSAVVEKMREVLAQEENNEVFFDITGGQGLVLTAFGYLSGKNPERYPMHYYDIPHNKKIELDEGAARSIDDLPHEQMPFELFDFINLHGGDFKERMLSGNASGTIDAEYARKVLALYSLFKNSPKDWNVFVTMLNSIATSTNGTYSVLKRQLEAEISNTDSQLNHFNNIDEVGDIIDKIKRINIFDSYYEDRRRIRFYLADPLIQNLFLMSGTLFEEYTRIKLAECCDNNEAISSTHIDWDGIESDADEEVINEIDCFGRKGLIPIFVSCKNRDNASLIFLYELDYLAHRFGGKYAKKILCIPEAFYPYNPNKSAIFGAFVQLAKQLNITIAHPGMIKEVIDD